MLTTMKHLPAALLLIVLLTQSYIDLELALPLGSWQLNAPVADLAALVLLPIAAAGWWRDREPPLPGAGGYALLLLASLLSVSVALAPATALHHLVRKPLFMYLTYGFGLSWIIARLVPPAVVWAGLVAWLASTAGLSLITSVGRILAGDALWFAPIAGLTPNHKTLAVSMAGGLPLLLAVRRCPPAPLRRAVIDATLLLSLAAILASTSKTAWIITVLSIGLVLPAARPLTTRWRAVLPVLALSIALAYYAPVLVGSKTMLDAARSRHSLSRRASMMLSAHPLIGSGTGMSVLVEQVTFPDYRVNGVDAHGVLQKVGGETGLLGLAGYALFSWGSFAVLHRRWRHAGGQFSGVEYGAVGTWAALSVGLLLSTETFSQTFWVPFATAWGLSHREPS